MSCVYAYYWYKLRIWEKPQRKSREASESSAVWDDEEEVVDLHAHQSKLSFIYDGVNRAKKWIGLTGESANDATKIY